MHQNRDERQYGSQPEPDQKEVQEGRQEVQQKN